MQATIAVLGQVGWHPSAPDKWLSADGKEIAELEWATYANTGIVEAPAKEFESSVWRLTSNHFFGFAA